MISSGAIKKEKHSKSVFSFFSLINAGFSVINQEITRYMYKIAKE